MFYITKNVVLNYLFEIIFNKQFKFESKNLTDCDLQSIYCRKTTITFCYGMGGNGQTDRMAGKRLAAPMDNTKDVTSALVAF